SPCHQGLKSGPNVGNRNGSEVARIEAVTRRSVDPNFAGWNPVLTKGEMLHWPSGSIPFQRSCRVNADHVARHSRHDLAEALGIARTRPVADIPAGFGEHRDVFRQAEFDQFSAPRARRGTPIKAYRCGAGTGVETDEMRGSSDC